MKKTVLIISCLVACYFTGMLFTSSGCTTPEKNGDTSLSKLVHPPLDIDSQAQVTADLFSWKTFIAMNWPATLANCGPDTNASILNGKGPVVWETYLNTDQIFVDSTKKPAPWCISGSDENHLSKLPSKVVELARKTGVYRFIHRTSKSAMGIEEAVGGPLVDQNGRFVRYEVRVNMDEYNYITAHNLWNKAGQRRFANDSTVTMPAGPSGYGPIGAMEFKAAWKILGKGDDSTRFYTIKAIVYNDETGEPSPGPNPVTLGLVGLHIAHKTAKQGNWVWSTFEQVDNLTKSFFNPNCDSTNCPPNQRIPGNKYKELDSVGNPLHSPTQVVRVNPVIDPAADSLNKYFQTLLKGSVWANYQLVSTQWLLFENIFPQFLANSVQETYVQGPHPASYGNLKPVGLDWQYYKDSAYRPFSNVVSSSCMGCHYVATLPNLKAKSDFSFILGEAK